MQRERAAGSLAKIVLYYKTHLAVSPYGGLRALYYNDYCGAPICATFMLRHLQRALAVCLRGLRSLLLRCAVHAMSAHDIEQNAFYGRQIFRQIFGLL